jgi:hypothetical protein
MLCQQLLAYDVLIFCVRTAILDYKGTHLKDDQFGVIVFLPFLQELCDEVDLQAETEDARN